MSYVTAVTMTTQPSGEHRGTMSVNVRIPGTFHAVEVAEGRPSTHSVCGSPYDEVSTDLPWAHGGVRGGAKACRVCLVKIHPASPDAC
jgi:hypothetical protein